MMLCPRYTLSALFIARRQKQIQFDEFAQAAMSSEFSNLQQNPELAESCRKAAQPQ